MLKKGLIALGLSIGLLTGSIGMAAAVPPDMAGGLKCQSAIACPPPYSPPETFDQLFDQTFQGYTVSATDQQKEEMRALFDQVKTLDAAEEYIQSYEVNKQLNDALNALWENAKYNYPEFSVFVSGWLPENISDSDLTRLKSLYDEAVAIENNQGYEAAQYKWDEFYNLIWSFPTSSNTESWPSFDEYMSGWMPEGISASDLELLKQAYADAVALSESGDSDAAQVKWDAFNDIIASYTVWPTFEQYFGTSLDDIGVSEADREILRGLYAEATALEKAGDQEGAAVKWDAIYALQQPYWDNYVYQYPPFDEYMNMYDFDISPRGLEQLKQMYDEATALEEGGNPEAACEKWNVFYYIVGKFAPHEPMPIAYMDDLSSSCVRSSDAGALPAGGKPASAATGGVRHHTMAH